MGSEVLLAGTVLGSLFFLLATGVWIGIALLVVGFIALAFYLNHVTGIG